MKKKILHLNFHKNKGGASIAAKNIYYLKMNNSSKYFFSFKNLIIDKEYFSIFKILFLNFFFKLFHLFYKKKYSYNIFETNFIKKYINKFDILHLHWIGNEFVSIKELTILKKPIVWTLHDDWLKNDIDHLGKESKKNSLLNFFIKLNQKQKNSIRQNKQVYYIAPSKYILSPLKKKIKNIEIIQHPINLNIFKLKSKSKAFKYLKIKDSYDKIFSIGGSNVFKNEEKGSKKILKLIKIINEIYTNKKILFIFFGEKKYANKFRSFDNIFFFNFVNHRKLSNIFNISDAFFMLSKIESFSLVTAEALACGCPVICHYRNGASELIKNNQNGFLIKENFSIQDLKKIFLEKYSNLQYRKGISNHINKNLNEKKIALKYRNVYDKICP